MKNVWFQCSPGFYIFLALAIVLIPAKWLIAWFIAAMVHEFFHILFLNLFRCRITLIELGLTGATIHTNEIAGHKMALCALAGPLGSALLLLLIHCAPRVAMCAAIQLVFNLLPVYPLDGGRVFRGITEHLFNGNKIISFCENAVMLFLVGVAVWLSIVLHAGLLPLICTAVLIYKNKKIPCKEHHLRVQ